MIDPRLPDFENTPADPRRAPFDYRPDGAPDTPAVSIVTPFFNTPPSVFDETARTVFRQSLQNFEWLIVNDGSADAEALAGLDRFRAADPRVRVVDLSRNSGPSAARNAGFAAARAELVFQLDADDLIEPTALEKLAWFLHSNPHLSFAHGFEVGFDAQQYLYPLGFNNGPAFLRECLCGGHAVMVRRDAHARVGGYDESIRGGMEDWEFWLRCADAGLWGATVPEYLSWYRRRENHGAAWENWDGAERQRAFERRLRERFPALFAGRFPTPEPRPPLPYETIRERAPFANPLARSAPRVLMILPWLRMGGADRWNLDLTRLLTRRGYEVTICTTLENDDPWLPAFAEFTPDIFSPHRIARLADHPALIRHLIESRRPDAVIISNSEFGYRLLPYLRAHCPGPAYLDYNHMEEEYWNNGGHPRSGAGWQSLLDLSVVSSDHLRGWMASRGAERERIEVCYTSIDAEAWRPMPDDRRRIRDELGVPDDQCLILFSGRLCAQKQPRVLAEAIRRLAARTSAFVALVVGDGEDRPWLERFIDANRLGDRIRLLGERPAHDMPAINAACDVFFLPSQWEGIALSVYEAMATGLTVVGAIVGGQAELVTPDTGILIEKGTEEQEAERYADALEQLVRDPHLRARMGAAARERVRERFRLEDAGDRMVALIESARRRHAESPRPGVDPALARELATQAVESTRVARLAEWLWRERERMLDEARANPADDPHKADERAIVELKSIEASRAWRLVQAAKRTLPYRLVARARFGPGWDTAERAGSPSQRLARIKWSRSYRVIVAVKRSAPYRWYTAIMSPRVRAPARHPAASSPEAPAAHSDAGR
ncbi:MAG: glycosyltransferase [Phycisphaerales bacterium]|nr:glycosyltransferase [Phycisphaerales bacterium]